MPKKRSVVVGGKKVVYYDLKAGEYIEAESHEAEAQNLHVSEGLLRIYLDIGRDDLFEVNVSESSPVTIPAGVPHMVLALRPSQAWSTYV